MKYIYITSDPLWLVYSAKPQKRKKKKRKRNPPKMTIGSLSGLPVWLEGGGFLA